MNSLKEQLTKAGFEEKKKKKNQKTKNPYDDFEIIRKMDFGNFKGIARKRLLSCKNPETELKLLIKEAYEIFKKKEAKRLVVELHLLKNELFENDEIHLKKAVRKLW